MRQARNVMRRYDYMEFPKYAYKPYPRWVTAANGETKIIKDKAEEIRFYSEAGGAKLSPEQEESRAFQKVLLEQNEKIKELEAKLAKQSEGVVDSPAKPTPQPIPTTAAGKPLK
jgi:hypothetical protein